MRTSGINISTQNLNNLQQKLSLSKGQVVKGQVADVHGNKVVLKIGTAVLKAESQVPLQQGQVLKLLVEGISDNIIKLRVISEEGLVKPEAVLLSRLGLQPSKELELIVQHLLRFKLPIDPEMIKLLTNLTKMEGFSSEMLMLAAWLKSLGIDVRSYEDMKELVQLLKMLKGQMSPKEEVRFFNFLNRQENQVLAGCNLYGWPFGKHHLYLITDGSKSNKLNPEDCTLVLKVASNALGDLWFKINYNDSSLRVNIICTGENNKELLEKEADTLRNGLHDVGYSVEQLGVNVGTINTVFDLIPASQQTITGVNYQV